jgi:GT2 family glycosyltransferase
MPPRLVSIDGSEPGRRRFCANPYTSGSVQVPVGAEWRPEGLEKSMSDPLATVIIPNYNGLRYLPRLMETLHAQSDQRFRITVVDDRSPGRDVDYLHSQWPDVHVIRNPHNLGFAGSCNAGMRLADTPLVVLLNNDTHVDVNWFAEGVRPFDDPRVAAVASLVVLAEPPHPIDTAGDIYSIAGGAV